MANEAEPTARLRKMLSGKDAETFVDTGDLRFDDLRALLDANAEALDALKACHEHLACLYGPDNDWLVRTAGAVLAKAGRR